MPVAHGHPQVVLHPPAGHHPVGVVPAERQRVVAVGPLVADPADPCEELVAVHVGILAPSRSARLAPVPESTMHLRMEPTFDPAAVAAFQMTGQDIPWLLRTGPSTSPSTRS